MVLSLWLSCAVGALRGGADHYYVRDTGTVGYGGYVYSCVCMHVICSKAHNTSMTLREQQIPSFFN